MKKVLSFLEAETSGKSFKTHKYCFDKIEIPNLIYDDHQNLTLKKYGETEKITSTRALFEKAQQILQFSKPIFSYFLDGSRRAYKVDDIAYDNRVYPIIAGQIGVGCCQRNESGNLIKKFIEHHLVLSIPENASKDRRKNLFFSNLARKINEQDFLKKRGLVFSKILDYADLKLQVGEKYENLGIAKIQDEMIEQEKKIVAFLAQKNLLNENSYLLKDGSLEYKTMKSGDFKDLSIIKSNYKSVVGVSKSFNPEKCENIRGQSNAKKIAELALYHRTPAFMWESPVARGTEGAVKFAIWYLRIRDAKFTASPFEGIVKIEKILISETEQKNGLSTEEVDLISANIINERNPVCYGSDARWANHLYPVYLTELFIKSKYLSNEYFMNLF